VKTVLVHDLLPAYIPLSALGFPPFFTFPFLRLHLASVGPEVVGVTNPPSWRLFKVSPVLCFAVYVVCSSPGPCQ
jgi:hypothetical protein